jgi:serine/threonine protein phosphatase PrpC
VERAGGIVEDGRVQGVIAISRALGDWEYKNKALKPEDNMVSGYPEVIVETRRPDHDFMIIACDGIWDCMTSQQAVDFTYETQKKLLKRASTVVGSSSPSKLTSKDPMGAVRRNTMGASPSKKSPSKLTGSISPTKKSSTLKKISPTGPSRILELMMDKCCPSNLAASEGLGADNMTGIIVQFCKPEEIEANLKAK